MVPMNPPWIQSQLSLHRYSVDVTGGISDAGFSETSPTQDAGRAGAAGQSVGRRIVTAVGQAEVDSGFDAGPYNFGFGHQDQRNVNSIHCGSLYSGLGGQLGPTLERPHEH